MPTPAASCQWHPPTKPYRRAISLLETTIAISILGVGLIMVAAIFPVALSQHRESADQARALDMVSKAEAMLHRRINPDLLYANLLNGVDSQWYLIPTPNIDVRGMWSFDPSNPAAGYMLDYTDAINGVPLGTSLHQLLGTDLMSDRIMPTQDRRANEAANRLLWYGFYRQLANGTKSYTVAICKQRRNQVFYLQDLTIANPTFDLTPLTGRPQRFPVPWRVTVSRIAGRNQLFSPGAGIPLPELAPPGSKIMIHGATNAFPRPMVPAGRILTVADTLDLDGDTSKIHETIQVLEDISDIYYDFDVWLFPPAGHGPNFGRHLPLLEWKVSL